MAESGGLPIPGETALITGAVLASQGPAENRARHRARGRRGDRGRQHRLPDRPQGRSLAAGTTRALQRQRMQVLATGEPFFERHGPKAVFFGRFILGLRVWASWLAGATRMPWRSFALWNACGGICWATGVGLLAYFLGHSASNAIQAFGLYGLVAFVLAVAGIVVCAPAPPAHDRTSRIRRRPLRSRIPQSRLSGQAPDGAGGLRVSSRRCRERCAPTCPPAGSARSRRNATGTARGRPPDASRALPQPLAPGRRQAGVGPAGVVFAGAALEQLLALEAVDQPRQAAARELGLLGQVAHAHAPSARVPPGDEHLIGGHRQPVRPLQLGVQALGQAGVRAAAFRARRAARPPSGPPG